MAFISTHSQHRLRTWHRRLTLVLMIQLGIWLITALVMTLIARSSTRAYTPTPIASYSAIADWPDTTDLSEKAANAYTVTVKNMGFKGLLYIDSAPPKDISSLRSASRLTPDIISLRASAITGEIISPDHVSLKTRNSPEYQKQPIPAWRVKAQNAVLFFDPLSGDLLTQTTPMKHLENWMKTLHVMDYTGNGQFRKNWFLSFFALLFLSVGLSGVLAMKRLYLKRPVKPRLKVHQMLGLVLMVQVFFWVSSGLSVAWLLQPLRDNADNLLVERSAPINWERVKVHPSDIFKASTGEPAPTQLTLTMLLGQPVYQAQWPGRNPQQALHSAVTGKAITLGPPERDLIAQSLLRERVSKKDMTWEVAQTPADLDFYFYTGPYPVWKGYFTEPTYAAVAIDQVTGHVHTPRTRREITLERYYNVHVVNWRLGVIKYRREPALLIMIGLGFGLLISGLMLHWQRRKSRP